MALYGFQPVLQMNLLTSEHPMAKKLKKESELLEYLHTLYFKVIETHPGEKFTRVADPTRRRTKTPPGPEGPLSPPAELAGLKLESHKDIARAFALSRSLISMNKNLARFEQLPIIENERIALVEEKSREDSEKLSV